MHIAVCDDNADDIKRVTFFINNRHTYKTFLNPSSLLSSLDDGEHFDLYILDICLGNKNGIELATEIKRYDKDPLICFISASNEFYRDAYNLYVFQYLLKPLSNKAFDDMLSIAEQRLKKCNNYSIILMVIVITLISIIGGSKSVTVTDTIMLGIIVIAIGYVLCPSVIAKLALSQ